MDLQEIPQERLADFRKTIASQTQFDDEQWQEFSKHLVGLRIAKGKTFVEAGTVPKYVGFVTSGIIKKQLQSQNQKMVIKDFSIPGDFVASYVAMVSQSPSRMDYIAVEETEMIAIEYKTLLELFEKDMCWQRLGRKVSEQMLAVFENREIDLLELSPMELYESFRKRFSGIAASLKQTEIAGYLGITPESLSRLTKRRRQK